LAFDDIARGARARRLGAAVLLTLAALARADTTPADDAMRVQAVIDAMKTGDVSAAVAKLGQGAQVNALASRADLVHVLCDRAFRFDNQKASIDARRTLAGRLYELATAAAMASPDDDRTRWALAEATVLRERAGPPVGASSWDAAADLLEKVHAGKRSDGLPLAYAVSFLLEGASSTPESAHSLAERADQLARRAMDAQKDSPTLALSIASSQFWAAKALVATKPKVSKSQLKATLDTLRPFATRGTPTVEIGTAFNDAVAFGRSNGVAVSDGFVTTPKTTLEGALQFDLPVSSRWSMQTVATTPDAPGFDYITELAADGARRRQILFRRYAWNQRYTFLGPNPVGGDNVRALTQGLQAMSAARVFAPGATLSTPQRRSCTKALEGYAFDVRGTAAPDAGAGNSPIRLFAYVVRGHALASYAVLVYVYGKDDELGPEMEAILASLREPEKSDR
jgi:hypothetical protein